MSKNKKKNNNNETEIKKQFMTRFANQIQKYEDILKSQLIKEIFEHLGEFSNELFFILDIEFIPDIKKSSKKYKLTYFSSEKETECEKSFEKFLKILENYKDTSRKESEIYYSTLVENIVKLKKDGFLNFI